MPIDKEEGERRRDRGCEIVAMRNEHFVRLARAKAIEIAKENGTVSADDLREWAERNLIEPKHPNAWGGVFRGIKRFEVVGYIQSKFSTNNARTIKVWRLKRTI